MKLILNIFGVCLIINEIHSQESHQSMVNTNGRPILRAADIPGVSMDPPPQKVEPAWMKPLRSRISQLVAQYGYEAARPHINQTVQDAEKENSVLLDVKGESELSYKYITQLLRTQLNRPEDRMDPMWLDGLKAYVHKLIAIYDHAKISPHLAPVITSLQKNHAVSIKDIDGNVIVDYTKIKQKRSGRSTTARRRQRNYVTQILE